MRRLKALSLAAFLLLVGFAILVVVLENRQIVTLVIFGWAAPSLPLAVLLLMALLLGLVVGPLLMVFALLRRR
ncbi:MAG: lipopolysaccharide assembly protein LapA domain-containing protein [Pseudomonas sp.]|uniref:lipopolysaccharide assembly protein LapA domain-containing protein n=1 Tax=Pseudomonas sp. TaxID=306 RepID=UPI003D1135FD